MRKTTNLNWWTLDFFHQRHWNWTPWKCSGETSFKPRHLGMKRQCASMKRSFGSRKKNVQQWLELLNFVHLYKCRVSVEYSMIVNLVCVSQVRYSFHKGMLQNLTTLSEINLYPPEFKIKVSTLKSWSNRNIRSSKDSCINSITCLICFGGDPDFTIQHSFVCIEMHTDSRWWYHSGCQHGMITKSTRKDME